MGISPMPGVVQRKVSTTDMVSAIVMWSNEKTVSTWTSRLKTH